MEDKRVDWLLERVEHRPLMFKLDRINKMKIDEHSMCVSRRVPPPTACPAPPRPTPPSPRRLPAAMISREVATITAEAVHWGNAEQTSHIPVVPTLAGTP